MSTSEESDVGFEVKKEFDNRENLISGFSEDDQGAVCDDRDPDWAEEYASKGNRIMLDAADSSDSSIGSEDAKRKYRTKDIQAAIESISSGTLSLTEASKMYHVPVSLLRYKSGKCTMKVEKMSGDPFKNAERPQRRRSVDEEASQDYRKRKLSVLIDEEEKADTDEIASLMSIHDTLQAMAEKQDSVFDLLTKFVKTRQSL